MSEAESLTKFLMYRKGACFGLLFPKAKLECLFVIKNKDSVFRWINSTMIIQDWTGNGNGIQNYDARNRFFGPAKCPYQN